MTDSRRTDHAAHDLDVLAAAADRNVDDTTRIAAERQAAECRDCAALFVDLRLISSGLAGLPKELPVPRDFRITPERAAKLRPAGWRGVLQGLLGSGPSLRPFATALTTLGVAGLLLTVALPGVIGGLGGASTGSAPLTERILSTIGSSVGGGGKSNDSASAVPAGAAASPATDRNAVHASPASNQFNSQPSTAAYPPGVTNSNGSPVPTTEVQQAPLPVAGSLAAISLGVLLLGLVLLVRSRTRPFDSAG
jgi:hypothetical protein